MHTFVPLYIYTRARSDCRATSAPLMTVRCKTLSTMVYGYNVVYDSSRKHCICLWMSKIRSPLSNEHRFSISSTMAHWIYYTGTLSTPDEPPIAPRDHYQACQLVDNNNCGWIPTSSADQFRYTEPRNITRRVGMPPTHPRRDRVMCTDLI